MSISILTGLNNFLDLIINNWATILAILGLLFQIYRKIGTIAQKVKDWIKSLNEEKINAAKAQIANSMLKYITDAEMDYTDMNSSGQIKRSQVIRQIYAEYPILNSYSDQEELTNWIDDEINNALKTLRKIIKSNSEVE